jgi:hypothetical protein
LVKFPLIWRLALRTGFGSSQSSRSSMRRRAVI